MDKRRTNYTKYITRTIALLSFSLLIPQLHAASENYQLGNDYIVIGNKLPTRDPSKVEVAEAFWYGCPHCYTLEPTINTWKKDLPENAYFTKIPVLFNREGYIHAALFYTIRALNLDASEVDSAVFDNIHKKNNRLNNETSVAAFLAKYGVSKDVALKTMNSFGVRNQIRLADSIMRGAQITGVPAVIVNGSYLVSVEKGVAHMFKVVDFLVEKEIANNKNKDNT